MSWIIYEVTPLTLVPWAYVPNASSEAEALESFEVDRPDYLALEATNAGDVERARHAQTKRERLKAIHRKLMADS